MKKFLSVIMMSALAAAGMVALTGESAQAACSPSKYVSCVATTTTVKAPASKRAPKSVPIRVSVAAANGAIATGIVTVVVTKVQNGRTKYTSTLPYSGGSLTFVTQSLKKGTYAVTATFSSSPNQGPVPTTGPVQTRFNDSTASTSFVIKKRRK